jgi:hypothetical protein
MASNANDTSYWTWDARYQDYYHVDETGSYIWASEQRQPQTQQATQLDASGGQHYQTYPQINGHYGASTQGNSSHAQIQYSYTAYGTMTATPQNRDRQYTHPDASDSRIAHYRGDSASYQEPNSNAESMPLAAPPNVRQRHPLMIPGTPERGWYEALDQSYRMRTGREAHQFFRKGRVFSMLWAEAASETAARSQVARDEDATVAQFKNPYTVGRFGQTVYSQIRRFVIMRVKRKEHFVYAW